MKTHLVIRGTSALACVLGLVLLVYGLAKIATAEESKPVPVQVDLPGVAAGTAPDRETRSLGIRALAAGGVVLFAGGVGFVLSYRRERGTRTL